MRGDTLHRSQRPPGADNPYAQGGLAVFGFVALSALLTIGASIGLAVVSVARKLRG